MSFQPGFLIGSSAASIVFNTSVADIPVGAGPYLYTSQPIGNPASSRIVAVSLLTLSVPGITGVVIGGVNATRVANIVDAFFVRAEIWVANVPTGTTVTIEIDSTAATRIAMGIYSLYGVGAAAPVSVNSTGTSPFNLNLTCTIGNVAIGCTAIGNIGADTMTWVGLTKDVDGLLGATFNYSSASKAGLSGAQTITATPAIAPAQHVAISAAWGP